MEEAEEVEEIDITDEQANSPCEWNQWKISDGRARIEVKEGTVSDCVEQLSDHLPQFLNHVYVKRRQSQTFKSFRENVGNNEVVIQIDFSENYTCREQDEIQAAHWNNRQISIFTAVAWFKKECDSEIQKQSFALISDYMAHDKYVVDSYIRTIFSELIEILPELKQVKIFSDGAASHFKQKFTLCHMTYLSEVFGFPIEWHFFESYHGKGAVDAIGGHVKRLAWLAVKSGKTIQNSKEFVQVVSKKTQNIIIQEVFKTDIEDSKNFLEKRWTNISSIPRTQKVHFVRVLALNTIEYAELSSAESVRKIHNFNRLI